jgi:nonsense-mediated mRNA decay protein 3
LRRAYCTLRRQVLGYDVSSAAAQMDENTLALAGKRSAVPDVVLVRKLYGANSKKRGWALRQLQVDVYQEEDQFGQIKGGGTRAHIKGAEGNADYERFMQQLESDKEMRRAVALYKVDKGSRGGGMGGGDDGSDDDGGGEDGDEDGPAAGDDEAVRLEELLTGLAVEDDAATHAFRDDEDDLR